VEQYQGKLPQLQKEDPFWSLMINYLTYRQLPEDGRVRAKIQALAKECFFENDVLWRRLNRYEIPRTVLCVPRVMADDLVKEAHGHLLVGHNGMKKTKERLLNSYYWPNMDAYIYKHINSCQKCQVRRTDHRGPPDVLHQLPLTTDINQRVGMDLFGPLKTSGSGKAYVLCLTDTHSKFMELAALPNKEASTVVNAVFEKWICRYGLPYEFISDNGKEFCNQFSKELYQKLQIKHTTTSAYHPQTNASAEVCNKYIAKYLASVVDASTLDWELYLAPLMFSYNTSLHETIKTTPFYLTYGIQPRTTDSLATEIQKQYGENDAAERINRLLFARQLANKHAVKQSDIYEKNFNKKAVPHKFKTGDLVLLQVMNFLGVNKKLSPKFNGPYRIIKVSEEGVAELLINGRKQKVNISRLKRFNDNVDNNDSDSVSTANDDDADKGKQKPLFAPSDFPPLPQRQLLRHNNDDFSRQPVQQQQQPFVAQNATEIPKRGRGRPRKTYDVVQIPRTQQAVPNPSMVVNLDTQQQQQQQQPDATERRITRSMAKAAALADPAAEQMVATLNNEANKIFQHLMTKRHHKKWVEWQAKNTPLDEYALPKHTNKADKQWVERRRKYLKRLQPAERNTVLTGDPLFSYDPILYDLFLFESRLADRIANLADQMDAPQVNPQNNDPVVDPEAGQDPQADPPEQVDPQGAVGPDPASPDPSDEEYATPNSTSSSTEEENYDPLRTVVKQKKVIKRTPLHRRTPTRPAPPPPPPPPQPPPEKGDATQMLPAAGASRLAGLRPRTNLRPPARLGTDPKELPKPQLRSILKKTPPPLKGILRKKDVAPKPPDA
jgi:transposase InsO family protein